jgi:murein DD-endopeptidase MepM/ murein hydrolase activator NlpD
MRSRLVWFLSGCFAGAVALYLLLWEGGVLSPYLARVRAESQAPPKAEAPIPSDRLIPPIQGLNAKDVLDTFNQARPGGRPHEATDIMEPRGTPVQAMVDGVVKKLFLSKPGGNTIYEFDDAQELCYYYAHLDRYAEGIQEGQHIQRGTVIAYVGSTGNASEEAPHLHLAIFQLGPEKQWWKGTPINPYPILLKILSR